MLVHLPRFSPSSRPKIGADADCSGFEAGLRRDLASAHVIAFEHVLGGWVKRGFDLAVVLLTAPLWGSLWAYVAWRVKERHPALTPARDERIGYGGEVIVLETLRLEPPSAAIVPLHAPKEEIAAANDRVEISRIGWCDVLERLPQLVSVLRGDMSLVGPRPIAREQLDRLKGGKKYYLSARPGVFSAAPEGESEGEAQQYRRYVQFWSLGRDIAVLANVVRGLRATERAPSV